MRHALVVITLLAPAIAAAQPEKFREAPAAVRDVLRAPWTPSVMISPDNKLAAIARPATYPAIAELAAPMLKLAGVRLDPRTNGPHAAPSFEGRYSLRKLPDGKDVNVQMPANLAFGRPYWNPDASAFAFTSITPRSVDLWIVDVATSRARKVPTVALNPLLGSAVQWLDKKTLLVKTVPLGRRQPPAEAPPVGPEIQDSTGVTKASSTYEARDLLRTPHDADLFEHYMTSQLAVVDRTSLAVKRIGAASVFGRVEVSPGGKHVLVSRVQRPYSYRVAWNRFAHDIEVWSTDGKLVERVAKKPVAEQVPIQGVPIGPRDVGFVQTMPSTLVWAEALDQGDWAVKAPKRDRIVLKDIGGTARTWLELEHRYAGLSWIEGGESAIITEWNRDRRWTWTHAAKPTSPALVKLWDRNTGDAYGDPGSPVYRQLENGAWVVRRDGSAIYLTGEGATPDGNRPFLDRFDLATQKPVRLFRADRTSLERFVAWSEPGTSFYTMKESPTDPPNLALRTLTTTVDAAPLGEATRASAVKLVTSFPDPTPQVRKITKRLVTTKRADGVQVSFTLYLPPDYKAGTRLPTVFWAYPLEYSDAKTGGQVVATPNEFTMPFGATYELFALAGYAVLDVSMPVIGPPETVYDTFVDQIVANAQAAVAEATRLGVTDPDRVGVTGHSHGALMTANLLAYSNIFRAGIARSGAYNHTLRPFGFQTEHRTLYQARDTYFKLSPLLHADKIDEPLLIIHGAIDANPGTVALQSEKLFEAVRGVGGTTRLIMLPFESHGYRARESVEHVMAEQIEWFDRYVKNAKPRPPAPPTKPPVRKPA